MKIDTSFNNFARGKLDHDMMGRYDLPIYQSGCDLIENFITNFKGNAIFRAGFEDMLGEPFEDCVMVEFKFNNAQQYICLFYANTVRFLSYDSGGTFGWVLDGSSNILEVATPYSLAECSELDFTQNDDVMLFTHEDHEPYKLTRASANSFTFYPYARKFDPFPLTWDSTQTITGVSQATQGVVTVSTHGRSVGDRVKISSITGMTELNDWTAAIVEIVDADNFKIDIDTTDFTSYSSGGTIELVLTGDYPGCVLFYNGRTYYGQTPAKVTTIWASVSGSYYDHTETADEATSALELTLADIAQEIEWLYPGENSLIAGASDGIVAINGGSVGSAITPDTVEATLTSAPGCNSVYPVAKDGLIFYVGIDGRNMYYFQYDLLKEAFIAEDANFVSYDITNGGITKIRHKLDRNDLIFATTGNADGNLLSCNFNLAEKIVGWHDHLTEGTFEDQAVITDNNGKQQLFCLVKRGSYYFIERQGEYVEFKRRVKFYSPPDNAAREDMRAYETADNNAYNRYVAEQMKSNIFVDNAQIFQNLQSNLITYDSGAGTITDTNGVFTSADVGKHIVYKTATGYESGRFEITAYTSANVVSVDVLQTPTANTYTNWYLSFDEITTIPAHLDGETVAAVTDGGYLNDYVVASNTISFDKQVTYAVVGYKYKGIIKSFSLGFQIQALNTQRTMKAISEFNVRCVTTAGLKAGSSLYHLEAVQKLTGDDVNYLPTLPIDGTKRVPFSDNNTKDKYFYLVQDVPLPAVVTSVMITSSYATTP